MTIRPCIFCPAAVAPGDQHAPPAADARRGAAGRIQRLAIPVYRSRVSPVLDTCTRLLLIDLQEGCETARTEIRIVTDSLLERTEVLRKHRVRTVICAGISQQFYDLLRADGLELITGIVGEVEQVRAGYVTDELRHPAFHMPGAEQWKRIDH